MQKSRKNPKIVPKPKRRSELDFVMARLKSWAQTHTRDRAAIQSVLRALPGAEKSRIPLDSTECRDSVPPVAPGTSGPCVKGDRDGA